MRLRIIPMVEAHWPVVSAIYEQGIQTSQATFESAPPACWADWHASKLNECSLVALTDMEVAGWAALSPFSSRRVYRGVAEVSLYVASGKRGLGIGDALMEALIERSETHGIWTLQAKIFCENEASIQLHTKHGFRRVGIREKLGRMEYGPYVGQWRDVVLMERRSKVVGI
jgi:phosphinothricin acetyltransferase